MKTINRSSDLALNGAPPAFAEPLHVGRPNLGDREALLRYVTDIYDRRWLTNNGPLVQELEARIAQRLGVRHCIAMCNGTVALEIAIRALGLEGEVIVPSWTFIATAHALYWQGITPVFADIDPLTHNLDPRAVRRMITPRTTGIIGVHLWGRSAPVDDLQAIANKHGLKLMFDAAHAFGSTYRGTPIGQYGKCEVLSFHATKCFNTMEGGAIVTNDDELAEAARLMRNFGFEGYDSVIHPGTNGKMIEICAAAGLANLDTMEDIFAANRRTHAAYREALKDITGVTLLEYDDQEVNSHHYVVLEVGERCVVSRDQIIAALQAENVLARRYFWPGCHRMKPYRDLYPHSGMVLPHTEQLSERIVVLPAGPSLSDDDVSQIGDTIRTLCRWGLGTF